MRNDVGVAIILLSWAGAVGAVFALTQPPTTPAAASPLATERWQPVYTIVPAMALPPPVKTEIKLEEPQPAGPPPAFSTQTPVATLMANAAARAVVLQDVPALASVTGDQIATVGSMSLRTVQSMLPAMLKDDVLKKLDQDLAKVPAAGASPNPTPAAPVVAAVTNGPGDPAAQTQAAGFSSRSTLASLLGNPAARTVLMREVPALAQAPQAQLNLAANMSLRDIQRLMPDAVTDAALQRVDQGLDALNAPAMTAAPAA